MTPTPPPLDTNKAPEGFFEELAKRVAALRGTAELVSTPSSMAQIGGMLVELLSSKKALTMIAGNTVLLTAIDKAIAKHEQFAMVCVVGLIVLTAVYIASQAYVDAHKKN